MGAHCDSSHASLWGPPHPPQGQDEKAVTEEVSTCATSKSAVHGEVLSHHITKIAHCGLSARKQVLSLCECPSKGPLQCNFRLEIQTIIATRALLMFHNHVFP